MLSAEADYKVKVDDLTVNDPEVKSAPNADARKARARFKAVVERKVYSKLKESFTIWGSVLTIIEAAQDDLKVAKEAISKMVSVFELEYQANATRFMGK